LINFEEKKNDFILENKYSYMQLAAAGQ